MSNIVSFNRSGQWGDAPSAEAAILSGIAGLRARTSEEIRNAVLMLDLSIQQTRLVTTRLPDEQVRQKLIRQIDAIERLIQIARDVSRRL